MVGTQAIPVQDEILAYNYDTFSPSQSAAAPPRS